MWSNGREQSRFMFLFGQALKSKQYENSDPVFISMLNVDIFLKFTIK